MDKITTRDKIKWLFTIASKNKLPKEIIYEYIWEKYGKDSVRQLTAEEIDDVTDYVSQSRSLTNEKMIYLLIKKAERIGISRMSLDNMAKKRGSHNLEDMPRSGLISILVALNGIEKKKEGISDVKSDDAKF